jgi:hypothetical protein
LHTSYNKGIPAGTFYGLTTTTTKTTTIALKRKQYFYINLLCHSNTDQRVLYNDGRANIVHELKVFKTRASSIFW